MSDSMEIDEEEYNALWAAVRKVAVLAHNLQNTDYRGNKPVEVEIGEKLQEIVEEVDG